MYRKLPMIVVGSTFLTASMTTAQQNFIEILRADTRAEKVVVLTAAFGEVTANVDDLIPGSWTTYRYDGPLTTPPCSEGVKWFVMTEPIQLNDRTVVTDRVGAES